MLHGCSASVQFPLRSPTFSQLVINTSFPFQTSRIKIVFMNWSRLRWHLRLQLSLLTNSCIISTHCPIARNVRALSAALANASNIKLFSLAPILASLCTADAPASLHAAGYSFLAAFLTLFTHHLVAPSPLGPTPCYCVNITIALRPSQRPGAIFSTSQLSLTIVAPPPPAAMRFTSRKNHPSCHQHKLTISTFSFLRFNTKIRIHGPVKLKVWPPSA